MYSNFNHYGDVASNNARSELVAQRLLHGEKLKVKKPVLINVFSFKTAFPITAFNCYVLGITYLRKRFTFTVVGCNYNDIDN